MKFSFKLLEPVQNLAFVTKLYHFGSAFVSPPRCILFQYTFVVLPPAFTPQLHHLGELK